MKKPIECRHLYETQIGDYCMPKKKMCKTVKEEECVSSYVSTLMAKCQNDVDELAEILDDELLRTFGDYLEALRNGF